MSQVTPEQPEAVMPTPEEIDAFRRAEGLRLLESVLFKVQTAQMILESANGDLAALINVGGECRSGGAIVTLLKDFWHKVDIRKREFETAGDGPLCDETLINVELKRHAAAAAAFKQSQPPSTEEPGHAV